MVPTAGDTLQLTEVLLLPVTVAAKVAFCPPLIDVVEGVTEMATTGAGGTSDIEAVAVFAVLAALAAVTMTVCADAIVAGAV